MRVVETKIYTFEELAEQNKLQLKITETSIRMMVGGNLSLKVSQRKQSKQDSM